MFTCYLHVENIQANFCLHSCTNGTVNDEKQQLEASFKSELGNFQMMSALFDTKTIPIHASSGKKIIGYQRNSGQTDR